MAQPDHGMLLTGAPTHGDPMREVVHLRRALASRTVIAQAQGILMERYDLDGDEAIAVLKRTSSHLNIPLRDIAGQLVLTRRLPHEITDHD